jgi:hypothetical protein
MEPDLQHGRRMTAEVRDWRVELLRHAGFGEAPALELAADERVDLHDLLALVDRGCPPDLAARIVAP